MRRVAGHVHTFDSRAPNEVESSLGGQYTSVGTLFGFRLGNIETDAIRIDVFDFHVLDEYNVFSLGWTPPGLVPGALEMMFTGSADLFSSAALPLVPPDLRRLSVRQFQVDGQVGAGTVALFYRIDGEVVALEAVPEPATHSARSLR